MTLFVSNFDRVMPSKHMKQTMLTNKEFGNFDAGNSRNGGRRGMKWILRSGASFLTAVAVLASAGSAHARTLCPPGSGFENLCNIKIAEDAGGIIGFIVTILIIIAILTSLFFIIFGAYRWVTSAGDQNKATQARQTIIAAIVGLIIALLTFFIINTVMYVFTGGGLTQMNNVEFKL